MHSAQPTYRNMILQSKCGLPNSAIIGRLEVDWRAECESHSAGRTVWVNERRNVRRRTISSEINVASIYTQPRVLRHTGTTSSVAALHQGAPGQMTWLEDPPPWLRPAKPCVLLCFGNSVNRKQKCYHIWPLYLFYFDGKTTLAAWLQPKKVVNFVEEKSASGWPDWRVFCPRNDLASLLRWRCECLMCSLHSFGDWLSVHCSADQIM